jgi:hypothetical protein
MIMETDITGRQVVGMAARPPRGRKGTGGEPLSLDFGDAPPAGAKLPGTAVRRPPGRVERSVSSSITAARGDAPADPRWAAGEALAKELGRGIDIAATNQDPYALAQLGPRLIEVLRELALTPASATVKNDLAELLADLKKTD